MASVQSDQNEQSKENQGTQVEENPLLFINRYSKEPFSRHHGPTRTAVNVHVQRTIRKKKQHDAMMRLKSSEFSKRLLKHGIAEMDPDRDVASLHQNSTYLNHHPIQTPSRSDDTKLQSAPEHILEAQFDRQRQAGNSNQIRTSQLVTVEIPAPFPDTLIPLPHSKSRSVEIALAFFLQTFIPRVFPVPSQAREHRQWVIQRAVTSPALYFAISTAGAVSLLALSRSSFRPCQDRGISQYDANLLETVAMKHLRFSLDSAKPLNSVILIYVIMCLMVTGIVNGNMNAIQVHSSALSRLIRSQKAQIAIPVHVMETFISSCYISSIITRQPPLPPPFYPTEMTKADVYPLLERIIASNPHLADLGQAFFDPSIEAALGQKLAQLIRNMRAIMLWREHYHHTRQQSSDSEMTYFHNLLWRTCYLALNLPYAAAAAKSSFENHYRDMPPAAAHQSHHRHQGVQEPCRIALLIFWNACNQVNRPGSLLYRTLAAQLGMAFREGLAASNLQGSSSLWELFDEHLHGMLLWVLLLGAFITHDVALQGGADSDEVFFIRTIAEYLRVTSAKGKRHDWKETEGMLKRFLYLKDIFGNGMEQCWVEIMERERNSQYNTTVFRAEDTGN